MRFVFMKTAVVTLIVSGLAPSACHSALAADAPKPMTPTIDVEIEDRAPDKSSHAARFSLSVVEGRAQLGARDGDAKYEIGIHAQPSSEASYALIVKRGTTAEPATSTSPRRSRSMPVPGCSLRRSIAPTGT